MTDLKTRSKMIVSVDFDGVVHDYHKGWQDGALYGHATFGFFEWYLHAEKSFEVFIHSSRFKERSDTDAVRSWLDREYERWRNQPGVTEIADERQLPWLARMRDEIAKDGGPPERLSWRLTAAKPPAVLTIDDRCVRFDGDWSAENLTSSAVFRYRPWNSKRP